MKFLIIARNHHFNNTEKKLAFARHSARDELQVSMQAKYRLTSEIEENEKAMSEYEYYEVLGCSKESSHEELKKAYKKLMLQHHPDKKDFPETKATEKFQLIAEAWKVLRDPEAKRKYDAECRHNEIESQWALIYDTITVDEMEVSADGEELSYRCRCGSYYLICKVDVMEKNCTIHIPCQECTFLIIVET